MSPEISSPRPLTLSLSLATRALSLSLSSLKFQVSIPKPSLRLSHSHWFEISTPRLSHSRFHSRAPLCVSHSLWSLSSLSSPPFSWQHRRRRVLSRLRRSSWSTAVVALSAVVSAVLAIWGTLEIVYCVLALLFCFLPALFIYTFHIPKLRAWSSDVAISMFSSDYSPFTHSLLYNQLLSSLNHCLTLYISLFNISK